MLHVRALPGRDGGLSGGAGAYALVFALATGEAEYRERVAAEMDGLGLFIVEIEISTSIRRTTRIVIWRMNAWHG
jgi:hypothetical protein